MTRSNTTEQRIGRYVLERRIGTGGMAEVWKGRILGDTQVSRAVAVKMILPRLVDQPGFVELFSAEARVSAGLRHSNIVEVLDLGRTGDTYYLVLEYVAGQNLANLLDAMRTKRRRLPLELAAHIVAEMCRALEHAHTRPQPVVHHDVSPGNILLSFDGEVKLTDFGIARVLGESGVAQPGGKIAYMSPEQIRQEAVDARSDVFSTALVLYELLSDRFFQGETLAEIGAQVTSYSGCPPERLARIPEDMRPLLQRALHEDPEKRFKTAGEMEFALRVALPGIGEFEARTALASVLRTHFPDIYALEYSAGDTTQSEEVTLTESSPPSREVTATHTRPAVPVVEKTEPAARVEEPSMPESESEPWDHSAVMPEAVVERISPELPTTDPGPPPTPEVTDTGPWDGPTSPGTRDPQDFPRPPAPAPKEPPRGRAQPSRAPEPPVAEPRAEAPGPPATAHPAPPRRPTAGAFKFDQLQGELLSTIIGIDLGTTYSCAASVRDGQPMIIPNELGRRTFSSAVYIHDNHVIVGEMALDHIATHPQNVIHSWKRLLGRDYNSPAVLDAIQHFAYNVAEGPSGEATVTIGDIVYRTPWLAARVIYEIRVWAREELGGVVDSAVITVPAYYTDRQRLAVLEAAKMAGLKHVRLLAEPVAAAIAHGLRDKAKPMMVYDFGGGTFDVTVIQTDGDVYEVVATGGDAFLGGVDFDDALISQLCTAFQAKTGVDLLGDPPAMARLRSAAETAKRDLSEASEARISLPFLVMKEGEPLSLDVVITREQLENLCDELIERSLAACDQTLGLTGLAHGDIGEILMIGGMTRMPRIRQRVLEHFKRRPRYGFADEAVALGAARFAGTLGKRGAVTVVDRVALSVGVGDAQGHFIPLINARESLPAEKRYTITSDKHGQTEVRLHIYQGNATHLSGCEYLGTLKLSDLKAAEYPGEPMAEILFRLDEEGILRIRRQDGRELMLRAQPRVTEPAPAEVRKRGVLGKLLGGD